MNTPKVSSKHQITIPTKICNQANIKAGDDVEIFVFDGNITIVKKEKGSGKGILSHIKANKKND